MIWLFDIEKAFDWN